jgi:hypothetical protein
VHEGYPTQVGAPWSWTDLAAAHRRRLHLLDRLPLGFDVVTRMRWRAARAERRSRATGALEQVEQLGSFVDAQGLALSRRNLRDATGTRLHPCHRILLDGDDKWVERLVGVAGSTRLESGDFDCAARAAELRRPLRGSTPRAEPGRPAQSRSTCSTPRLPDRDAHRDGRDRWTCGPFVEALSGVSRRERAWLDDVTGASGAQQYRTSTWGALRGGNPADRCRAGR